MTTASDIAFLQKLNQRIQDNFDYASSNSVAKAILFRETVEAMITLPNDARNSAGESMRYDMQTLLEMKRDVSKWISRSNIASSQIVYGEYCDE